MLLDKIYKFENKTYELGGEAALSVMNSTLIKNNKRVRRRKGKMPEPERGTAVAAHTTCYEQKAKVMGLKAANAFWNPFYFDPHRRTLSKPLIYLDDSQLREEVQALLYLSLVTNRSLILPNVLGDRVALDYSDLFQGRAMWPGFRTAYIPDKFPWKVSILEPSFYWRMVRDFSNSSDRSAVPAAAVLSLMANRKSGWTLRQLEDKLLSPEWDDRTRVVLHMYRATKRGDRDALMKAHEERVALWADDSVGAYREFEIEKKEYGQLPKIVYRADADSPHNFKLARRILNDVRLCANVFEPDQGNRSCFNKCK